MKKSDLIPECWDELTQEQFEYILKKVFVLMADGNINTTDVLRDFADALLGKRRFIHPLRRADYLLMVDKAAELMQWLFVNEGGEVALSFDTTKNLLPEFGKMVGPKSAGMDLRFGEYRKACWMYNKYTTEGDVMWLDGLVGILYRKPSGLKTRSDFNGDYREPFNQHHIERYAERVKRWPECVKWGVYLWFGYFCKALMTEEFIIDGEEICFSRLFTANADTKKDENLGMTSVLFTLAESRTFGTVDETDNAFLFHIMLKLLNDDITARKLNDKNDK